MPDKKKISNEEYLFSTHKYVIKDITGFPHLLKRNVVNASDLTVGDKVQIVALTDGKFYLERDTEGIKIEQITLSHILFEGVTLEETYELP